jgi:hypothetical protein
MSLTDAGEVLPFSSSTSFVLSFRTGCRPAWLCPSARRGRCSVALTLPLTGIDAPTSLPAEKDGDHDGRKLNVPVTFDSSRIEL